MKPSRNHGFACLLGLVFPLIRVARLHFDLNLFLRIRRGTLDRYCNGYLALTQDIFRDSAKVKRDSDMSEEKSEVEYLQEEIISTEEVYLEKLSIIKDVVVDPLLARR